MNNKDDPFIMIALYGRFKGETGYRWHCLPICDDNRSGIPFRKWIGRLMHRRVIVEGRSGGWLFSKPNGTRARMSDYNDGFVDCMYGLHESKPHLFSKGTLMRMFALRRSLRRGAILETTNRVSDSVIKLINRWRKKEGAKGAEPGLTMQQTYTHVKYTFPQLKLYSKAL